MNRSRLSLFVAAGLLLGAMILPPGAAQTVERPAVLGLKAQAAVFDSWLKIRLERLVPEIMRQEGLDLWLVICRENNEDPVFMSLVPFNTMYASRLSILVFHDKGAEGVERLSVGRSGPGGLYKAVWDPAKSDQWTRLAEIIRERNPKRIGINESETFNYGDGLSASLKASLVKALGPEMSSRLVSAERVAVRVLERRSPEELEVYPHIMAIAHGVIAEAFSRRVITPGVTTTDDVVWWMRERTRELGQTNWFQATVDIQRPRTSPYGNSPVIHRGDLLHCDFGIVYIGLCTDTQQLAYVLKEGETDAPEGLKKALANGNRLQDIHMEEMKVGRTGNEVLASALKRARDEGIKASIYTHPLGRHGHAAGAIIGLWDKQEGVPGLGDFPLFYDTVFSIELNAKTPVPEWGGQEVTAALEQDASFTKEGARFLDVRPTTIRLIK